MVSVKQNPITLQERYRQLLKELSAYKGKKPTATSDMIVANLVFIGRQLGYDKARMYKDVQDVTGNQSAKYQKKRNHAENNAVESVIFRKFDGEVIAFFPYLTGDSSPYTMTMYAHDGQHGAASEDFYRDTKRALSSDYLPLKRELHSLGYKLKVLDRMPSNAMQVRRAELQGLRSNPQPAESFVVFVSDGYLNIASTNSTNFKNLLKQGYAKVLFTGNHKDAVNRYDDLIEDSGYRPSSDRKRNPSKGKTVRLDIATMLPTTRTGQGTALYETDSDGYVEFISGTPCTKCVKGSVRDRHSICDYMISAKSNPNVRGVANPKKSLGVAEKHQLKILRDNFKLVPFMRTHSLAETRSILKSKFGYSDKEIDRLEYAGATDAERKILDSGGRINPQPVKRNATAADFKKHQTNRLQELSRMFQGEANGDKHRVVESDYAPKDKYRLGYLVQIKIKDGGKIVPINFNGETSILAGDLKNNLWAVGEGSILGNVRKATKGQLRYLGEVTQVDYVTAKKHIEGGKTVRFYHKLGEVTGEKPNLFIDSDGFPVFVGGGYDIWNVGIVN